AVSFFNGNIGTAVGGNEVILRTTDNGDHWTSLPWSPGFGGWFNPLQQPPPPPPPLPPVNAISMSGPQARIAIGESRFVWRTDDGGANWTQLSNINMTATLFSVSLEDPNTATAVGEYGTILATDDGGATWVAQSSGTSYDLHAVSFVSRNIGWAVGDG